MQRFNKISATAFCALVICLVQSLPAQQPQTPDERLLYSLKESVNGFEEALKDGANPNAKFPDGMSVLQFILRSDLFHRGIHSDLYLLFKAGVNVEGLDLNDRVRLFHYALRMSVHIPGDHIGVTRRDDKDHPEIGKQWLNRLKSYKLNINSRDSEGNTPLMLAVVTPTEVDYFEWLLKNGADANLRNQKKQNALDIFKIAAQKYRADSADDGGFEGAAEYHKKNEEDLKRAEQLLTKATQVTDEGTGKIIGKVFSADGKLLQITGKGVRNLDKGQRIIIKSSGGKVKATITEILHTKAKARITGKGSVETGDSVYLAR